MMGGSYFRKHREEILPWVKDWTDPQDQIRNEYDVKKLSFPVWFLCHPSAFKTMHYGPESSTMFTFLIVALIWPNEYTIIFGLIVALLMVRSLLKKIKSRQMIENLTIYDVHMRDWPEIDQE